MTYGLLNHTTNVRDQPSRDAAILTRHRRGTLVEVSERLDSGWLKIVEGDGYGYIADRRGGAVTEIVPKDESEVVNSEGE